MTRNEFETILRDKGVKPSLIEKMSDKELEEACNISGYTPFIVYLNELAHKYYNP